MTRFLGAALVLLSVSPVISADKKPGPKVTYDEHVRPILRARCFSCHGTNKKEGGLNLSTYASLRVGGGSGEVVEPGAADDSYLWNLVNHDAEPFMPPKADKLPAKELALIKAWIEGGALENSGSKFVRTKPKFNLSLGAPSTERPEVPAFPTRMTLSPTVTTPRTTAITALATSPWAPLCAVAGQTQILLYDTRSLELIGVLPFPEGIAHTLKFSRNGNLLLAGGGRGAANGKVVVWDVKSGKRLFDVGEELDVVFGADISSDQSMVVLGSSGKAVRCYSTSSGELLWEVPKKHTEWLYCTAFSPDGVLVATSDRNGGLYVWEADTGRMYLELRGHSKAVTGLTWRADSNILASCSQDGTIRLWEMENGKQVKSWGSHGGGAFMVEFCRDGNLVSCGRDKVAKLFKQDGGQIRAFPGLPDLALEVTYCDETKRVIAGDYSGVVRVYNAADGKHIGDLAVNPPTLETRLAQAQAALTTSKTENDKQQAAYKALQTAATQVKANLDAANKTVVTLQAKEKTLAATIKATQAAIQKLTQEHAAATKTVTVLTAVVPLLKDTTDKAQATAAKATDDKELAAAAAQLKTLLAKRTASLASAKTTQAQKAKDLAKSKTDLTNSQKQAAETKTGLAAAQKRAADLTKALKPAMDKAAAAKTVADAASAKAAAAVQAVERWQDEIAFQKVLTSLGQKQGEYDQLADALAENQAELKSLQTELDQRNTALTEAQKQYDGSVVEVTKASKLVSDAQAVHAAAVKVVQTLDTALPLLKESQEKVAAAAKTSGDKELTAAAAGLKTVYDKKLKEIEAGKKTVVARKADVDKAQKVLADMQKASQQKQTLLTEAKKRVAAQTTLVKPVQTQVDKAQQAADASKKQLDAVQQQVDVFKAKTAKT